MKTPCSKTLRGRGVGSIEYVPVSRLDLYMCASFCVLNAHRIIRAFRLLQTKAGDKKKDK